MKKLFLFLSLVLITPMCQAGFEPVSEEVLTQKVQKIGKKRVRFASMEQVRTFKPSEPAAKTSSEHDFTAPIRPADDSRLPAPTLKPRFKARVGNSLLGIAMIWAGPFATAKAIEAIAGRDSGLTSFRGMVFAGALFSGAIVTLAGFEKIKSAIWV